MSDPWSVVGTSPLPSAAAPTDPWAVVKQGPTAIGKLANIAGDTPTGSPTKEYDYSNPWANMQGDPNLSLGDLKQSAIGATGAVVGLPGDLESLGVKGLSKVGLANENEGTLFPTTQNVENWFGQSPDKRAEGYRTLGEIAGSAAAPSVYTKAIPSAVSGIADAVGQGVGATGRGISAIAPGATARAVGQVENIAPLADRSSLGERMVSDIMPQYDDLYSARAAALEDAAPSSAYASSTPEEQAALNKARVGVYGDPQYKPLTDFENSKLGKQLAAKTGPYSDTPRLDPMDLPAKTFRSSQSVKDLKRALGAKYENPQDAIERYASDYAAQSLRDATQGLDIDGAAKAANRWASNSKNLSWLNETPATKAAVQHYVDRLQTVAKVQRVARPLARFGAYGTLGLGGFHYLMGGE